MSLLFENFEGNRGIKESLSLVFSEGRLPHAILFEGAPGSGTDILAGIVAKAAVCLSGGDKPCGKCAGCIKAEAGSHPDIFTLDGESNPRAFPVSAIREIRSDAYIRPNEAKRKVYILLGVQNMSEVSQNALLKILEEPPENVLFLMTAASAAALLPTVRSRVQTFSLSGGDSSENWDEADKIARAVIAPNESELLFITADFLKDKDKLRGVLKQMSLIFRDAVVLRAGGASCLSGQNETAAALSGSLTRQSLLSLLEETKKARRALEQNANSALLITSYCAGLRNATGR